MPVIASEVKQEILGKVKSGEQVASLAKHYGISDRTIYTWLRKEVSDPVSPLEYGKLRKENLVLKEIVVALTVEVEKLKKRPGVSKIRAQQEILSYLTAWLGRKLIFPGKNQLIRLLGITKSVFWYHSRLPTKDEELKEQILAVLEYNPSYGHRRIALALGMGKKRVRRVMRLYGIKPYKRKARWRKRRDERRPEMAYANLVKGGRPIVPNLVWVADFTYIKYQSFIYTWPFSWTCTPGKSWAGT